MREIDTDMSTVFIAYQLRDEIDAGLGTEGSPVPTNARHWGAGSVGD